MIVRRIISLLQTNSDFNFFWFSGKLFNINVSFLGQPIQSLLKNIFPGEKYRLLLYTIHFSSDQVDLGKSRRQGTVFYCDYHWCWVSMCIKLHHTQNLETEWFLKGFSTWVKSEKSVQILLSLWVMTLIFYASKADCSCILRVYFREG